MSEKKELVTTKTLFHDIDALYDPEYEKNLKDIKKLLLKVGIGLKLRKRGMNM